MRWKESGEEPSDPDRPVERRGPQYQGMRILLQSEGEVLRCLGVSMSRQGHVKDVQTGDPLLTRFKYDRKGEGTVLYSEEGAHDEC